MNLHNSLIKYNLRIKDLDKLAEVYHQRVRDKLIVEWGSSKAVASAKNLTVLKSDSSFILVFHDMVEFDAYLVSNNRVVRLEFLGLDYAELIYFDDLSCFYDENTLFIAFRRLEDDFIGMTAPVAVTYVFY